MIRAVIFDFGNVLAFPPAPEKLAAAAAFCGLNEHVFLEAFWKERLEYDAGRLTPLEYWAIVTNAGFAAANLARLIEVADKIFGAQIFAQYARQVGENSHADAGRAQCGDPA